MVLVTDGLGTVGDDLPQEFPKFPVYVLACATTVNFQTLKYLAQKTGGQFFNIVRGDLAQVANSLGDTSKFGFISAEYSTSDFEDVLPAQPVALQPNQPFVICGKLKANSAKLKLNYGFGSTISISTTHEITKSKSKSKAQLIPRLWAGQKIEQLSAFPDENKEVKLMSTLINFRNYFNLAEVLESLHQGHLSLYYKI